MNGGLSQFARVLEDAHFPERRQAMRRYDDIDPSNIDPDTNAPYANYSSPSLDTSFHDGEMDVDDEDAFTAIIRELSAIVGAIQGGDSWATHRSRFKELEAQLADIGADQ